MERLIQPVKVSSSDDHTALLYYTENDAFRWNAQTDVGTQVIVTYSFTDFADLPALEDYDPYGADGYWSYDAAQRDLMRDVMEKYEAVSGVKFVEIEGDSMINIFGADVSGVGGWGEYFIRERYKHQQRVLCECLSIHG